MALSPATTDRTPVAAGPVAAVPASPGARRDGGARPGFVWTTSVFFDDLDAMGVLHNAAYLLLVERASSAFFEAQGWRWESDPYRNPDQHYVVREQSVLYLEPVRGPGPVAVEMWVTSLGRTSAAYCFEVRSVDGATVHARARRVHVKLDPATLRPSPGARPWACWPLAPSPSGPTGS
ncbi:MAG: acyl-CoA thioesterase [Acidimicrobiales bacterium]